MIEKQLRNLIYFRDDLEKADLFKIVYPDMTTDAFRIQDVFRYEPEGFGLILALRLDEIIQQYKEKLNNGTNT